MEKRQVIENLNISLLILKDAKNKILSDKNFTVLKDSIEEALRLLGNDLKEDSSKKKSPPDIADHPTTETIDSLGLSPRSSNALKRAGYMNIKDLRGIRMDRLKNIKGLGDTCLNEIMEKAGKYGIKINS